MTEHAPVRGFILQPTYRIERGRPVVSLYGVLETGESFLVRDHRQVPCFWVLEDHAERAAALGADVAHLVERVVPADRVSFDGEPVARVEVRKPPDAPPVRDRLHRQGVPTFEADVRFALRYLIDRSIRGSLAIRGPSARGPGIDRVFEDPEVEPAAWTPELSVLSFDLETDPRPGRPNTILSVALHGCGASEVLMVCPEGSPRPRGVVAVPTEGELLAAFAHRVRELDPDVLTGWNVIDFDLRVLVEASERWGGILELGRGPGAVRLSRPGRGRQRGPSSASVPGRSILDGIQLLRGASVRMESYALDAVAHEVLGEGKTVDLGEGGLEVLRLWREDRPTLAEYNLNDARLALAILERLELVELAVERSRLTGLPPERMGASIAAFDFLYLAELGRRGVVAPTIGARGLRQGAGGDAEAEGDEVEDAGPAEPEGTSGGAVLEPRPGVYENVLVFDFRSLYPSLIRTFGIDPLNYLPSPQSGPVAGVGPELGSPWGEKDGHPIVAPNGAAFRRDREHGGTAEPGILPALLDELFPRREAARLRGDRVASYAVKILMNSFYGVLATPACRFYNPQISNAITGFGREVLGWSRDRIESWGNAVLYGDTDSLFVRSDRSDPAAAQAFGKELVGRLNRALAEWIGERWQLESKLEMQLERLYLRLLLPSTRGGGRGAAKRYVGLIEEDGERRTVFTGMEVVRRDWTELARTVQRELYERLFSDRPIEEYLRGVLADLRAGGLDELLVYHKGLRKAPSEYTATTPPHVRAARQMAGPLPDVIAYVVTVAGPEPAGEVRHDLDYGHYVEKQLRPVAEPVLELVGQSFDVLTGQGHQLGLF